MGSSHSQKKKDKDTVDIYDHLRNLGQAYRDDQKITSAQGLIREIKENPEQGATLREITLHEFSVVKFWEQVFRACQVTYSVNLKQTVVELCLAVCEGATPRDLQAMVECGASQCVLDVFAFAKAYRAPLELIVTTIALVEIFTKYDHFAGEFVEAGGSKILFSQLIALYPTQVPKLKSIQVLRVLSQNEKYLKGMTESGGVSYLVQALERPLSTEFVRDALKIVSLLSKTNAKLLSQIMENGTNLANVLRCMDNQDDQILDDGICILFSLASREKACKFITKQGGFKKILEVLQSKYVEKNRRMLYHTLAALAHLCTIVQNCQMLILDGGVGQVADLMGNVPLHKSAPQNQAVEDTLKKMRAKGVFGRKMRTGPQSEQSPKKQLHERLQPEHLLSFSMAEEKLQSVTPSYLSADEDIPESVSPASPQPAEKKKSRWGAVRKHYGVTELQQQKQAAITESAKNFEKAKQEGDLYSNLTIKASIKLCDKLADNCPNEKEHLANTFAFPYIFKMMAGVTNYDLGIMPNPEKVQPQDSPTRPLSSGASPRSPTKEEKPPPPLIPPATAPAVFEVVNSSIQLLAKLCAGNKANQKALAGHDKFSRLLGYLQPSQDSRNMRLALSVNKVLDNILPDVDANAKGGLPPDMNSAPPLSEVLMMVVITSLCEIINGIDLPHITKHKSSTSQVQLSLLSMSMKVLSKFSRMPDHIVTVLEHLPVEQLRKSQAFLKTALAKEARSNQQGIRPILQLIQNYTQTMMKSLAANDEDTRAVLIQTGLLSLDSPSETMGSSSSVRRRRRPKPKSATTSSEHSSRTGEGDGAASEEGEDEDSSEDEWGYKLDASVERSIVIEQLLKEKMKPGRKTHIFKGTDNLADLALKYNVDINDFKRLDGKVLIKGTEVHTYQGLVITYTNTDDDWMLSDQEKVKVKMNRSMSANPSIFHKDAIRGWKHIIQQHKDHIRTANGEPVSPRDHKRRAFTPKMLARMGFTSIDFGGEDAAAEHAGRRTSAEEREYKQQLAEEEAAKKFWVGTAKLNRDYLIEYQYVLEKEDGQWQNLILEQFHLGVEVIEAMLEDREAFIEEALQYRVPLMELEHSARFTMYNGIMLDLEFVARALLEKQNNSLINLIIMNISMVKQEDGLRQKREIEEAAKKDQIMGDFLSIRAMLRRQEAERLKMEQDEEAGQKKMFKEFDKDGRQLLHRRQKLDVTNQHDVKMIKITNDRLEDMLSKVEVFRLQERTIFINQESRTRSTLDSNRIKEVKLDRIAFQMLHTQAAEEHSRKTILGSYTREKKEMLTEFMERTLTMAVKEQTIRRYKIQDKMEKRFLANRHEFEILGVQVEQEYPRKLIWQEARKGLQSLYKKCASEAIVLYQKLEDQRRYSVTSEYAAFSQRMNFQAIRLQYIVKERKTRSNLGKTIMQELMFVIRQGHLERASIGLVDLVVDEKPLRRAIEEEQDQAWWYFRTDFIIKSEALGRKLLMSAKRKEYDRVGKGLQDYMHMLDLDKTSHLFNIKSPNDVLLVPFIIPRQKPYPKTLLEVRRHQPKTIDPPATNSFKTPPRKKTHRLPTSMSSSPASIGGFQGVATLPSQDPVALTSPKLWPLTSTSPVPERKPERKKLDGMGRDVPERKPERKKLGPLQREAPAALSGPGPVIASSQPHKHPNLSALDKALLRASAIEDGVRHILQGPKGGSVELGYGEYGEDAGISPHDMSPMQWSIKDDDSSLLAFPADEIGYNMGEGLSPNTYPGFTASFKGR